MTTDTPLSKIPCIVNLASQTSADRTIVVGFDRGFHDGKTANGLPRPDVAAIQDAVQVALIGDGEDSLLSGSEVCAS